MIHRKEAEVFKERELIQSKVKKLQRLNKRKVKG